MRIIAGSARGREIVAPKGLDTRPVTDFIRESLFNIWQFDIEGCDFLDLFSGSGCMGLEALSRGARRSVMVDAGNDQVRTIRGNLKRTGLERAGGEVVRDDVFHVIGRMGRTHQTFDIIYLDPPFTVDEIFLPVMEALADGALLAQGGTVAIRTRDRKEMPDDFGVLHKVRLKRFGSSTVHFYERVERDEAGQADEQGAQGVGEACEQGQQAQGAGEQAAVDAQAQAAGEQGEGAGEQAQGAGEPAAVDVQAGQGQNAQETSAQDSGENAHA